MDPSRRLWLIIGIFAVIASVVGIGGFLYMRPSVRVTYTYATDTETTVKVENVGRTPLYNLAIEPWGYDVRRAANRLKHIEREAIDFRSVVMEGDPSLVNPGTTLTFRIFAPYDAIYAIPVVGSFEADAETANLSTVSDFKPE